MAKVGIKSIHVNLNDKVRVQVTAHGYRCWEQFHRELGVGVPDLRARMEPGTGMHVFHLHEVAAIFGRFMCNGLPTPLATTIEVILENN